MIYALLCCFIATTLGTRIGPQSCSKCMISSFRASLSGLASPPLLREAAEGFTNFARLAGVSLLTASGRHYIFFTHIIWPSSYARDVHQLSIRYGGLSMEFSSNCALGPRLSDCCIWE